MHNKWLMMLLYEHGIMHKHVKFACNKDLFSYFYIVNDAYLLSFKVLFHKKGREKNMYRALQENY